MPTDEVLFEGPPRLGHGRLWWISIVCFLAWVVSVFDFVLFGTLLPVIAKSFGWAVSESTAVATWVTAGTFVVSLVVGPIVDRMGRKPGLIITTVGAALSSGLSGLTTGALSLIGARSISGLGYSEEIVNSVYLNEAYGKSRRRGFIYSFVQSGWPVGALLAALFVAVLMAPLGWRGLFLTATLPALIIAALAFTLKESPAFHALKRARQLRASGQEQRAHELAALYDVDISRDSKSGFRQLLAPDLRRHTIFLSLAYLLSWMAIQIFSVLGTTILVDGKGVSFSSALIVLILANVAAFLGYIFHGFIGDWLGRRRTICFAWVIGGIVWSIMLFGPNVAGFVIPLYAVGLFFLNGPFSAMLFYMGESFPARVRGLGSNTVHVMGPIGALVGAGLLTVIIAAGAPVTVSAFISGALALVAAGLCILGTHTITDQGSTAVSAEPSSPNER
jgi:MFS family permease